MKKKIVLKNKLLGITLLEVIVSLMIIAIVSSYGLKNFNKNIQKNRVVNTAEKIKGILKRARFLSITYGEKISVCASKDIFLEEIECDRWNILNENASSDAGIVLFRGVDIKNLRYGNEIISTYRYQELAFQQVVLISSRNIKKITFSKRGTSSNNTTFYLTSSRDSSLVRRVILSRVGRVRSCITTNC